MDENRKKFLAKEWLWFLPLVIVGVFFAAFINDESYDDLPVIGWIFFTLVPYGFRWLIISISLSLKTLFPDLNNDNLPVWQSDKSAGWRRFWARLIDFSFVITITSAITNVSFLLLYMQIPKYPMSVFILLSIVIYTVFNVLGVFIYDNFCLIVFGNTPGKAIHGIRLRTIDGKKPNAKMIILRTWEMIKGMFLFIGFPLITIFIAKSNFKGASKGNGQTDWDIDTGIITEIKRTKLPRRFFGFLISNISLLIGQIAMYALTVLILYAVLVLPEQSEIILKKTKQILHLSDTPIIPSEFNWTFEGFIDDKYPISAKITKAGKKIQGKYYYHKIGQDIILTGNFIGDDSIKIDALDSKGKITEYFSGKFVTKNRIEGDWVGLQRKNKSSFYLVKSVEQYSAEKKSVVSKETFTNFYKTYKPSIFAIYAFSDFDTLYGTGFFVSPDGIAVSNYHVLKNSYLQKNNIVTYDRKVFKMDSVLLINEEADFIVFTVVRKDSSFFTSLPISNLIPDIGETVYAIGNPKGLEHTLSTGIISSFRANGEIIQTTAEIASGSSGGPLLNSAGEVIGITTATYGTANLNFAISINLLNIDSVFIEYNRDE